MQRKTLVLLALCLACASAGHAAPHVWLDTALAADGQSPLLTSSPAGAFSDSGMYFYDNDGTGGQVWFIRNSTMTAVRKTNMTSPLGWRNGIFTFFRGHVWFVGNYSSTPGDDEPFVTDSSSTGAHGVADLTPGTNGSWVTYHPGRTKMFISSWDSLWVTDGTPAHTFNALTWHSTRSWGLDAFTSIGTVATLGDTVFAGVTINSAYGTPSQGVYAVGTEFGWGDIVPGSRSAYVGAIFAAPAHNAVYFTGNDSVGNAELFIIEPNGPGGDYKARLYATLNPGGGWGSSPGNFHAFGNKVYFVARTDATGNELWVIDSAGAVPRMVADICPGSCSSDPDHFAMAANGVLMFKAFTQDHGDELWRTDGTAAGTRLVQDLNGTMYNSYPDSIAPWGNGVVFNASPDTSGLRLYYSEGDTIEELHDFWPSTTAPTSRSYEALSLGVVGNQIMLFTNTGGNRNRWVRVTPDQMPTLSQLPDTLRMREDTPLTLSLDSLGLHDDHASLANIGVQLSFSSPAQTLISLDTSALSGVHRSFRLVPASNASGTVTLRVRISDGGQDTTLVRPVVVTPVNDLPTLSVSAPTHFNILEDDTLTLQPATFGATDVEGDSIRIRIVPGTATGLTAQTDSLTWISLAHDQFGSLPLSVKIGDGKGWITWPCTLMVAPVNDAPVFAGPHTLTLDTAKLGQWTFQATDVDNATLTYSVVNQPSTMVVDNLGDRISLFWRITSVPDPIYVIVADSAGLKDTVTITASNPVGILPGSRNAKRLLDHQEIHWYDLIGRRKE